MILIQERLIKIFIENLNKEEVDLNKSFIDAGIDELDKAEAMMRSEDEFGVEISDLESDQIFTIQELVECINQKLEAKKKHQP